MSDLYHVSPLLYLSMSYRLDGKGDFIVPLKITKGCDPEEASEQLEFWVSQSGLEHGGVFLWKITPRRADGSDGKTVEAPVFPV